MEKFDEKYLRSQTFDGSQWYLVHFETLWRSLLKLKRKLTGETIEILKRKFDYRSTKTTTRF